MGCAENMLSWLMLMVFFNLASRLLGFGVYKPTCWYLVDIFGWVFHYLVRCPFLLLGKCGGCVLSRRECSWASALSGHWRIQVETRFWELTLRNENRLDRQAGRRGERWGKMVVVAERVHRTEKSWVCHPTLCRHLGMEAARKERPHKVICYKAGDRLKNWNYGLGGEDNPASSVSW